MKTKLFYLFIAILSFSFSGKAQNPVITLIGSGNGGWNDTAETPMLTSDGITYTLVDKVLTSGEVKFREGKCWTTGCPATVGNTFGWGPVKAVAPAVQSTGWPSGTNGAPQDNGPNIQSQAGVWNITFNRLEGSWSFTEGTPLPVIKLVGSAVVDAMGAMLATDNGTLFYAKKVPMKAGNCQFSVDGSLLGDTLFPDGTAASSTSQIPVTTSGVDYDVTLDYSTGAYTFKVATFPTIAIVGEAVGGWPRQAGNPGPIDVHQMTTTDGVTYTINNLPVVGGGCLFRGNNEWNIKYGSSAFPMGTNAGGADIPVPAEMVGTYNVTLNATTGAYNFSKITYSLVGGGAGGWGPFVGPDPNQLSTIDGINYTINGLVLTSDGVKFRLNNAWAGGDWGGTTFPAGTKAPSENIPAVAGTYNLTVNVLTGAYDFGTALSVKNINAASFKVYPNPSRGSWNITSSNDDITSVRVYDVLGKTVYAKNSAAKEVSVNASELSKGVYFAKVSSANGTSTIKLIKE